MRVFIYLFLLISSINSIKMQRCYSISNIKRDIYLRNFTNFTYIKKQ